jgi:hypothetical protein
MFRTGTMLLYFLEGCVRDKDATALTPDLKTATGALVLADYLNVIAGRPIVRTDDTTDWLLWKCHGGRRHCYRGRDNTA